VAALPTADPVWAAGELRRAHRELGFIGGSLPLNAFASLRSAQTLAPLFSEAQKHGSHLFIHRASASSLLPDQPPVVIPDDTGYARWPLINNAHLAAGGITLGLTDFLDPYPDVSVEIVMLAGFTPYLLDTWVEAGRSNGVKDPLARLRRVYFDTGPYATRAGEWVALAAGKIGADRILFGTDFGVGGGDRGAIAPALARLDAVLTPQQRQLIYVDNSRQLLKAKGRT
jgi:predicted TIM-barrel fold metal-dependent hydrolase